MLFWSRILILVGFALGLSACAGKLATPAETIQTYIKALKRNDTATMKLLLSDATLKMHEKEAKAQETTLDEIVKRESLISEGQRTVEFRNEKIEGERATVEVKNTYGSWETIPLIRESGTWKIDKQGIADQFIKEVEEGNEVFEVPPIDHMDTPPANFEQQ
jgi:hypothetical protein